MDICLKSGLLKNIKQCLSPNCDERPFGVAIDLIVVHGISLPPGEFGGDYIEALFTNQLDFNSHPYFQKLRHLKVSAHVLIKRCGEIIQFVPFHQRAWHAGNSEHLGRVACNDFSIGIELEGDNRQGYEKSQYIKLSSLALSLMKAYPDIAQENIVGHSDIAPGRKTDPGSHFNWTTFYEFLRTEQSYAK